MRTKTINLYNFNELSKEAQEKAIEDYRNDKQNNWDDWWEYSFEDFHERLKEIGIECKTFYFDTERGRYFRMDEARIVDEKLFLMKAGFEKQLMLLGLKGYINYSNINLNISEERETTNSVTFEFDCEDDEEMEKDIKEILGEDFEEELTDYLQNILKGFLKDLDKEWDYRNSDECLKEDLIANEAEFIETGERQ